MSDQDVFEQAGDQDQGQQGGTENTENAQETSSQDVFADKLSTITNEDGTPKYTDVASALDSIPHAQSHIQTLESEAAELKAQLEREKAAKELLAKQVQKPEPSGQPGLTAEDVARIAQETQQKANQANAEQANVNAVNAKFSELYGGKAVEQMQTIAKESGMSVAAIKQLAKQSPQAVFRLAGINTQQKPLAPKTPGSGSGDQFNEPRQPDTPKSVMGGSSTKEIVNAWKQAGEIVAAQNQQ